jgi:hypothetical protein
MKKLLLLLLIVCPLSAEDMTPEFLIGQWKNIYIGKVVTGGFTLEDVSSYIAVSANVTSYTPIMVFHEDGTGYHMDKEKRPFVWEIEEPNTIVIATTEFGTQRMIVTKIDQNMLLSVLVTIWIDRRSAVDLNLLVRQDE